jgi:hypothetical protein
MGPTIDVGSAKAQGSKAKPTDTGQSCLEQLERGMKRYKESPAAHTSGAPSRGADMLKVHI